MVVRELHQRLMCLAAIASLALAVTCPATAVAAGLQANQAPVDPAALFHFQETYGRLPLYFMENRGQVDRRVKFYASGGRHSVFFTQKEVVFSITKKQEQEPTGRSDKGDRDALQRRRPAASGNYKTAVVRQTPVGLRKKVELVALEPQEQQVNYFIGNDPQKWHTQIPTYKAVLYREAYPGIDLKFYGTGQQVEYDIVVKPGADPSQVKFKYAGIKGLEVTPEGDLAIKLPDGGILVQKKPVVYQEIAGTRVAREGRFRLRREVAEHTYGFEVAAYDRRHPLVIDPVLLYSTYLGGSASDQGHAIAVDEAGNAYVTGLTHSADFPTMNPLASGSALKGTTDVFVIKLHAGGNALVYSTYLGGSSNETGNAIAVDQNGCAYVTGETWSYDFPTQNPLPQGGGAKKGNGDVFVTQLSAAGNALVYSTYLGGTYTDTAHGIAVDAAGCAYVTGETWSNNFPMVNPFQGGNTSLAGFVTKIQAGGGDFVYSTYLRGASDTGIVIGYGIAVDSASRAHVTGLTASASFPNHYNCLPGGGVLHGTYDAFVIRFSSGGSSSDFSTYLGGGGDDYGYGIAVDRTGKIYVTGQTNSTNFPTKNPWQAAKQGGADAFVACLSPPVALLGLTLSYSTYLGGSMDECGQAITVDRAGRAYVTGQTASTDFPTKNPVQPSFGGGDRDAFVTTVGAAGSLVYSTFLGGSGGELANDPDHWGGIAVDNIGNAYVTGWTSSTDFPVKKPYQGINAGGTDAFVTKISAVPHLPLELLLLN